MKVSVIIPTYNEEKMIGECLESLGKQTYKDIEVIVIDDGSTDTTSQLLRGAGKTGQVKVFSQGHKGAGAARNLGASKASGEILVFVDADMTFDKDFITKLIQPIVTGRTNGTFSKEEYVSNWDNVWARCWNLNQGWEPKRRHPKGYPNKQKVFRAILRSEFETVGGFDPKFGYMDDWSLSRKLKYQAVNAPGAIFYHQNAESLKEIFLQAKWIGKRPYKLGKVGAIYALLRVSLPESLWAGFWKSIFKKEPLFLVFKIVYDFGVFIGILEYVLFGKVAK
jgi:glycosyltransferase involved in cell wall biosynthesis